MKFSNVFYKLSFSLFVLTAIGLFAPQTVFCQTEKLGIVSYTPPKGWTKTRPKGAKTTQENLVQYIHINKTTDTFCVVTLYGATNGTGNPDKDFDSEWNILAVKPFKAAANPPRIPVLSIEGWTLISGGSEIEFKGRNTKILLTVFSGFGKAFSVLTISDDKSYKPQVQAFIESFVLDKPTAP
ncbi:MAG: hypothetical protein ACR2MG_14385 [Pyrinomonadaceae bacterium]